jgi:hypothetical protein
MTLVVKEMDTYQKCLLGHAKKLNELGCNFFTKFE